MTTDDLLTYDTFSSSTNETTHVNMSRVELHQVVNCTANGSGYRDPRCDKSGSGSLLAPLSMATLGIVGNILGLIIIYSSRPEAHNRRTVFFIMLSGLAWSDLIAQFCVSPIAILVYINDLQWIGGAHLCRYHGFVMTSFGLVTPLVVSCMSIERLMAIRFSYFYAKHITQRRASITFFMCLLIPFLFSLLPFAGFGSYELQHPSSWCFLNFHRESTMDAVYAGFFSCINISAILVMIFCNVSVVVTLFMMRQSRKVNNSPSFDRRISVTQISNGGGAVIRSRKHSDMEAQMIWFLCLITIAFSVCWLPFNVHILCNQFTGNENLALDLLFVRMVGCNQILDPWLYVIFRKSSFMRLFKHIKRLIYGRRMTDDILNEALRNEGLRKRSFFRSSTIEVTTLNRTIGNGHSRVVNNYMEDNLENLKKILENERKLGREMYSRISEKTEYSESTTQQEVSAFGERCSSRNSSVNRELGYGSVKSHDNPSEIMGHTPNENSVIEEGDSDDLEMNDMKYDDIKIDLEQFPVHHNNGHLPCTNTRSCPIQGTDPLVSQPHDHGESTHPLIGRQKSMPTTLPQNLPEGDQQFNPSQMCPSGDNDSKNTLTYENSVEMSRESSKRREQKYLKREMNFDDGSDYDLNDEVFESADNMESAILFSGDGSFQDKSKSKKASVAQDSDVSESPSQHLPENLASDSQSLLS